jgi:hypothetical protein
VASLDPRILKVGLTINGSTRWFQDIYISVKGTKFTSPNMGQCEITLLNMARETRAYLLRECSPFSGSTGQVSVTVEAGRESYGTSTVYRGDVFRAYPTQAPNMGVTLKCMTGFYNKGVIVSRSGSAKTLLSSIAQWIATDNGYTLSFEITDAYVASYSFTGSAQAQLQQFAAIAQADVYVDNGVLYVKDSDSPSKASAVYHVNKSTGMIGAPEITETGCKVSMLYVPGITIGGQINVESTANPAVDGGHIIYKAAYHLTNRDTPFYLQLEGRRISG